MRDDHDSPTDGSDAEHAALVFDVQRASAFTPEGQIESAGHFARGLGAERMRRAIAVAFFGTLALIAVLAIAAIV